VVLEHGDLAVAGADPQQPTGLPWRPDLEILDQPAAGTVRRDVNQALVSGMGGEDRRHLGE
jgi:hypothetical protein